MNSDLEVAGDGRSSLQDRRSGSGNGTGGDGGRINRREQGLKITLATHGVYLAFIALLYMIIQIHFQNQRNSPFQSHMVMKSSLVALGVYSCATILQIVLVQTKKELDDPRLLIHVIFCFGILTPLSIALVFLPKIVGYIVIVLFAFATIILLAYDMYKLISKWISERNNSENNYTTTTSELVASEITGIGDNAATTSESGAMNNESSRNNNNAETTSESEEMNNESSRNNDG